jgi:ribonuclease PH
VASITGAYVALALAINQLVKFKQLAKSPLTGALAAISVGILGGVPLLDLCYEEDSRAEVDANVVMTDTGRFVEYQATAEHMSFDDEQMAHMTALAKSGIAELIEIQKKAIEGA